LFKTANQAGRASKAKEALRIMMRPIARPLEESFTNGNDEEQGMERDGDDSEGRELLRPAKTQGQGEEANGEGEEVGLTMGHLPIPVSLLLRE